MKKHSLLLFFCLLSAEIQSAVEMQQNGVSVNELQFQLLQKVEELTLYIIEQDKQIKELQQKIGELEK